MRSLISAEYAELNRQLHTDRADYGAHGGAAAAQVVKLCQQNQFRTVLDFGCGKGMLKPEVKRLDPKIKVYEFDPAIPGKDTLPTPGRMDLIVALDVMEHVEADYVVPVFEALKALRPQAVFLAISTAPAKKALPDGRNAHLSVHSGTWWEAELLRYFAKVHSQETTGSYMFVGTPK